MLTLSTASTTPRKVAINGGWPQQRDAAISPIADALIDGINASKNTDELQLYMQFASMQRRYHALPQDPRNRVARTKNGRLGQFDIEANGP
jgi:hypothetical protein